MSDIHYTLPNGKPKTVIVTGSAGGIGAQTIRAYSSHGCNVVVADLSSSRDAANSLISSLSSSSQAMYQPTNIVNWNDIKALFRETKNRYGQVDIVVANAGLMESKGFFDFEGEEDESGELKEPSESWKVIDVNLKGTMNSMWHPKLDRIFKLNYESLTSSNALNEVESTRLRRVPWLCHIDCVNVRLLRWHGSSVLHLFKTWSRRSCACFTKVCESAECASQRHSTFLYAHLHHIRILGTMEGARLTGKHARRRG